MNTNEVIILARKHIGNGALMDSSARLCLADAVALQDAGDLESAKRRAIKSLAYSVGILHGDYARAAHKKTAEDAAGAIMKPVAYYVMDCIEGDECVLFHCQDYNSAMQKCMAEMIHRPTADLSIWNSRGEIVTLRVPAKR